MGAERETVQSFGRPEDGLRQAGDWYRWGPYVSERRWGTVQEDYSPGGDAWGYLPHDQTGWTGLIGDVILRRRGSVPSAGDVLQQLRARSTR
jgi:hypothetical protein